MKTAHKLNKEGKIKINLKVHTHTHTYIHTQDKIKSTHTHTHTHTHTQTNKNRPIKNLKKKNQQHYCIYPECIFLLIICNFYMFFTFVLVCVSVFVCLFVHQCMVVQLSDSYGNLNVSL